MKTKLVLAITGGIAAYKTPDLVRRLQEVQFEVRVVVTQHALAFVSQLTLETLLPGGVYSELMEPQMQHIALAKWADGVVIAPATAHCLAKLAHGYADDLMSTLCLATRAPLFIAPAMNHAMWSHPCTQTNVQTLLARKHHFIGPEQGEQACGDNGMGRMSEPATIVATLQQHYHDRLDLSNLRILISMGATEEPIDPVRVISNKSSGRMGAALANAAHRSRASVTVICGAVTVDYPNCDRRVDVQTAQQMASAVHQELTDHDIFISVAAISDYTVEGASSQKIKRSSGPITLTLRPTEDILAGVCQQSNRPFTVGFAAETDEVMANAKRKLAKKGVDMLVVNDVSRAGIGFAAKDNAVSVLYQHQAVIKSLEKASKDVIAHQLLALIHGAYVERKS